MFSRVLAECEKSLSEYGLFVALHFGQRRWSNRTLLRFGELMASIRQDEHNAQPRK
jgi:hypothetical protein